MSIEMIRAAVVLGFVVGMWALALLVVASV